jgi:acetylornithine/succinyldiaminopimelate/putrescine aminotransferase
MFAGYDPSVLQFKPGLLVDQAYCDEAHERLERAVRLASGGRS